MKQQPASAYSLEAQIRACCQTLDDKKAENLKVLHLGDRSSLTEYFLIATGTSQPHLRAIRVALEDTMQRLNSSVIGVDSDPHSGWVVVDVGDFMVHVFTREVRDVYKLDVLWRDADDVTAAMLAPESKPEAVAPGVIKPAKRKPAAKVAATEDAAIAESKPKRARKTVAKAPEAVSKGDTAAKTVAPRKSPAKKVTAKKPSVKKPAAKKPAAPRTKKPAIE
ncbi:MAG: ribosome silencing factor [Verrucomicrobiota bacterium]|nr:ribosome silencing factor [Verrucomicrobiota bacterium]